MREILVGKWQDLLAILRRGVTAEHTRVPLTKFGSVSAVCSCLQAVCKLFAAESCSKFGSNQPPYLRSGMQHHMQGYLCHAESFLLRSPIHIWKVVADSWRTAGGQQADPNLG